MRHMGVPTKTMATGIRNQESGKIISEVNDHSNFLSSASINDYEDSFYRLLERVCIRKFESTLNVSANGFAKTIYGRQVDVVDLMHKLE